jgi:MFS family permease
VTRVEPPAELGLGRNWRQFTLLVIVNAFVGAMVGLERAILPALAEQEFHLVARTAILSFIAAFGAVKAATNYFAGRLSDGIGRKPVLVAGWILALPVPFVLMWAPTWGWVLFANVLLGASQGLAWSTTVIMKIDLVGAERRGLAMGLNEFAGYVAVAASAFATGYVAAAYGLRPWPFALGVLIALGGLLLSLFWVRETRAWAHREARNTPAEGSHLGPADVWRRTTWRDRTLSTVTLTGFVNNLNDGMAWGLFPVVFASAGLGLKRIGTLAALYPLVWGLGQAATGELSDRWGRKWLVVGGMWLQAAGIGMVASTQRYAWFVVAAIALGLGTAMVYPTLLAIIGDVAHPARRASAVGVYRLWRDLGYVAGALISGLAADLLGPGAAVWIVAGLTFGSGVIGAWRLAETRPGAA